MKEHRGKLKSNARIVLAAVSTPSCWLKWKMKKIGASGSQEEKEQNTSDSDAHGFLLCLCSQDEEENRLKTCWRTQDLEAKDIGESSSPKVAASKRSVGRNVNEREAGGNQEEEEYNTPDSDVRGFVSRSCS